MKLLPATALILTFPHGAGMNVSHRSNAPQTLLRAALDPLIQR